MAKAVSFINNTTMLSLQPSDHVHHMGSSVRSGIFVLLHCEMRVLFIQLKSILIVLFKLVYHLDGIEGKSNVGSRVLG